MWSPPVRVPSEVEPYQNADPLLFHSLLLYRELQEADNYLKIKCNHFLMTKLIKCFKYLPGVQNKNVLIGVCGKNTI